MARIESGISENLDRGALAVVFLMVAVFGLAQGLTYPLLSFILERQGTPAWLIGAKIYWDGANERATTTATGNILIGIAMLATGGTAGETLGRVRLNGVAV